jgi:hypothetical protein
MAGFVFVFPVVTRLVGNDAGHEAEHHGLDDGARVDWEDMTGKTTTQ